MRTYIQKTLEIIKVSALLLVMGFIMSTGISAIQPASASAEEIDIVGWLCAGANFEAVDGPCTVGSDAGSEAIGDLLARGIGLFSLIVGIIAVVMIMIGGIKYITSGGDSGNVTGAKNTILYAVVGLVVVALAQIIVKFVLGSLSGITG